MSANAAATGARHAQAVIASACVGELLTKAEKKTVPRAAATEADVRRAAGRTTDADRDDAVARIRDTFVGFRPRVSRS
ncbi:MAG TPA: hypothetical protein VK721_16005 [Solirubrobacteraceae bacterium]|jgi:hypothetical protein|nr:hypothetical protein [Solirubrobacteraceae bacterium]